MAVIQGQNIQMNLTAKTCVSPLLGNAACVDTLSGELCDGFAENAVRAVFYVTHISHTDLTKGVHI